MSLNIALAGNPNSGKTTLFNALTGLHQHVGNWPRVTVERKEGRLNSDREVQVIDLPGAYSLAAYSLEETITREYLLSEAPDVIVNVIDGTNLERNLFLTTQLLELDTPVVVAVNLMDAVAASGRQIDLEALSRELGCPVVGVSALKRNGLDQLADAAKAAAQAGNAQARQVLRFTPEVEEALTQLEGELSSEPAGLRRFLAVRLFEQDSALVTAHAGAVAQIADRTAQIEESLGLPAESIITTQRYRHIDQLVAQVVSDPTKPKVNWSDRIDTVTTNRWLALPIFVVVIFTVYYIAVTTVGTWLTDWTNDGVFGEGWSLFGLEVPGIPTVVESGLTALNVAPWLSGLILDGIVGGVGAVLGFVPQMLVLFALLATLEGCGYIARVAFILDRAFRRFGLSGKSFIPMLVSTGCGIPGVMSSRTIESQSDRRLTVMTTTMMPCGAKLPIIALISGAVFGGAWWVAPSTYFLGVGAIVVSGLILKKTKPFAAKPAPFVMELPAYRLPALSAVLRVMWERGWSFIKRAGTIILISAIVIWFLSSFGFVDGRFTMVEDLDNGLLAGIATSVAWIFAPLGFGTWGATVATITGLVAKENVVGTLGVLYGFSEVAEDGTEIWTQFASNFTVISAYSFLVFNLLCAPCFAAIGAISREMNNAR
ncbi:MAG: ferrous iron transport protein B, partial [Bifidobacteriaceae bacterium]|nr:ferrous iron transport protein B [Bifidobacteriaceae bacterium]